MIHYDDVLLHVYIPRIYINGGLFMIGFTGISSPMDPDAWEGTNHLPILAIVFFWNFSCSSTIPGTYTTNKPLSVNIYFDAEGSCPYATAIGKAQTQPRLRHRLQEWPMGAARLLAIGRPSLESQVDDNYIVITIHPSIKQIKQWIKTSRIFAGWEIVDCSKLFGENQE